VTATREAKLQAGGVLPVARCAHAGGGHL